MSCNKYGHRHDCVECGTRYKCHSQEFRCERTKAGLCQKCYEKHAFAEPSDEQQEMALAELDTLRARCANTMPGGRQANSFVQRTSTAHYLDGLWIVGWVK
jgi:hypothetical protein